MTGPPHAVTPPRAPADRTPPPVRELLRTWALAVGGLAAAKVLSLADPTGLLGANLAGVAAVLFIVLPDARLRARGETWDAYGLPCGGLADPCTWRAWARGAAAAVAVAAIVFPLFAAAFVAYAEILPELPPAVARALAPYGGVPRFSFRLPDRPFLLALVQLVVVALPEEMLYRGYIQSGWARTAPERGVTVLGARLGAGFVRTQLLFALGHLVVPQPWRLATFFPGLLFGWIRERTGGLAAPVVLHALSNLFVATLEASFYR